jgi:uncharacterized iron-regulated protein
MRFSIVKAANLAFFLVVLLASVLWGRAGYGNPLESWQTAVERDHPLIGKICDPAKSVFLDAPTLAQRLTSGTFVLLGEKHDNPDHHRLQVWVLRALIAAGRRPAVGFEMFNSDDGPAIARRLAASPNDTAGLADAVNWSRSGWPDWALYEPIARAALEAGLPIIATNLPRSLIQTMARKGLSSLDTAFVKQYALARPLPPDVQTDMVSEMRDSHCGQVSESVIETMIMVQRARDAQMADSLVSANLSDGAVLIAGIGHVRKDRGVPAYLALVVPQATVLSLTFMEVKAGETDPTAYATRFGQGDQLFDYLWFTPRVDNLDPCEKFGKQLERLRKHP